MIRSNSGVILLRFPVLLLCYLLVLIACRPARAVPTTRRPEGTKTAYAAVILQTPSPSPTWTQTATSTLTPTPEPQPVGLWIEPGLEGIFAENWSPPSGSALQSDVALADIKLQVGAGERLGSWIFVAASAFPSTREEITLEALKQAWSEGGLETTAGQPLLVSQDTAQILNLWLGPYDADGVRIIDQDQALEEAWEDRSLIALLPFEALQPRWKVLMLDGQNPLHDGFDQQAYPLTVPIGYTVQDPATENLFIAQLKPFLSNFDENKLTDIALTGVTALVRGTALTMEAKGVTYPAEEIQQVLQEADILHISNEIPFYSECPPPVLYPEEIKFCSSPRYIELLEFIGTDIIELDGDHLGDFGTQAMFETLKIYQERGLPFYGGGINGAEARQPVLLTHNGNQLAFIGCNAKGIEYYATANEINPGAVQCDFTWLTAEISKLKAAGYQVITTFQHNEYYRYEAQPDLIRDFRRVAQAGAVIVSGSQAHQPHGMEFFQDSFIHYGLGNLFFDQYRFFPGPDLDRAFIDRHYFYDQRYISTELVTIQFIDLARSRLTTGEERIKFLDEIFSASGW